MNEPKFGIIIPMYNAETTIAKAIDSVIRQTYSSWELVIVNDYSSDNGQEVCKYYIDEYPNYRISLINLQENSGNAKKPWEIGVKNSNAEFCLKLDSDDALENYYLEKLSTLLPTKADVIIPTMVMIDNYSNEILGRTPNVSFKCNLFSGKEACKLTIPEWQIGCNGMAFKKSLFEYVLAENDHYYMNSDEFSERIILYHAEKVALSDANYLYYQHPGSITHKPSKKLCEILYVDVQIIAFVKERYDSELLKQSKQKLISRLIVLQKQYIKTKKHFSKSEWSTIVNTIRTNYKEADWGCANMSNLKSFLYSRGYPLFALICYCTAGIDVLKKICSSR